MSRPAKGAGATRLPNSCLVAVVLGMLGALAATTFLFATIVRALGLVV